jgi:hypothetical protein
MQRQVTQLDMFDEAKPTKPSFSKPVEKTIAISTPVWLAATEQMLTRPQRCRITKQTPYLTYIVNED